MRQRQATIVCYFCNPEKLRIAEILKAGIDKGISQYNAETQHYELRFIRAAAALVIGALMHYSTSTITSHFPVTVANKNITLKIVVLMKYFLMLSLNRTSKFNGVYKNINHAFGCK
ncbi:MAG: hypothetical protein V4629_11645 [Pseudomonadota bacterium]